MKKTVMILVAMMFSTFFVGAKSRVDHPQQFTYPKQVPASFDAQRLQRLDSALQSYVDRGLAPQFVTFVAHKGQVVHNKAYGWRNIEKQELCTKSDIFRMASQTKAITAVALMTLYEEGKFQLDDPISKYIPEFANPRVLVEYNKADGTYSSKSAKREITIRDVMTHTSGISYNGVHWNIATKAGVPPLNSLDSITLGEMVRRMAKLPLAHEPGEAFTYSMNIEVLGYLIEILSNKPITQFLQERIFTPLGMKDTYFYLPDAKASRLVSLYGYPKDGPLTYSTHPIYQTYPIAGAKMFCSTGAGLSGTIEDYAKFCQMVMNGGTFNNHKIIGRKTLDLMKVNQVRDLRGDIGFGLAWDVYRPEYAYKSIVSEGSSRWGGMFGTDYVIDYSEDLIVLIYINMDQNRTGVDFKASFHNLLYQALN